MGVGDKLKTPYSHVVDFSLQRELSSNFVFEASYVGRFAHRLLQNEDLAEPLDLRDPKTGTDYFTAAQQLARMYESGNPPATTSVAPIAYWEDMFPERRALPAVRSAVNSEFLITLATEST